MNQGIKLRRVAEITGTVLDSVRSCSGRYVLENSEHRVNMNPLFEGSLKITNLNDAEGVEAILSRIFEGNEDRYPESLTNLDETANGCFIHVKPNSRIFLPLETCFYITRKGNQVTDNIIYVEDGAEVNIVTTCAKAPGIGKTMHIGSTYILLGRKASLIHSMVHYWDSYSQVKPSCVVKLEDDSSYVNNFVSLNAVKNTVSNSMVICGGENSRAVMNNVVYVSRGSTMDIGGTVYLNGRGARTEMNTRAVCLEKSKLVSRGLIEGNHEKCKGHLECRGLVLDDTSVLEAVPILRATRPGPELTHEAGIGGLSQREISYLMMRKMTEDEAVGALIRGFMDIEMEGLPREVYRKIDYLSELTAEAS